MQKLFPLLCLLFLANMGNPAAEAANSTPWDGPLNLAASKDQSRLFVALTDANALVEIELTPGWADTVKLPVNQKAEKSNLYPVFRQAKLLTSKKAPGKIKRRIPLPGSPLDLAVTPDGKHLLVSLLAPDRATGTLLVLDTTTLKKLHTVPVGHTPTALDVSPDGKIILVCNRFDNDISVINGRTFREVGRLPVRREPTGVAITSDSKHAVAINLLPQMTSDDFYTATEVSVLDLSRVLDPKEIAKEQARERQPTDMRPDKLSETTADNTDRIVRHLNLPTGTSSLRGVAAVPGGRFVVLTHLMGNFTHVTSQVDHGWINTNMITFVDTKECRVAHTVGMDGGIYGAANPYGITVSPNAQELFVLHAGTSELSRINLPELAESVVLGSIGREIITRGEKPGEKPFYVKHAVSGGVNDYSQMVGIRERIPLPGEGARNLLYLEKSKQVVVPLYFEDEILFLKVVRELETRGGMLSYYAAGKLKLRKPQLTDARRGEILFNSAKICHLTWQSCESCHPDARSDAINWDLVNDGIGNNKNTKSMLLSHKTPPAMISGVRPSAEVAVRSGIKHILFYEKDFEKEALLIDAYLKSLKPAPSPYLVDGKLSKKAQRGKLLFESERVNCVKCHPAPHFTDGMLHKVKAPERMGINKRFDTPTLVEVWRTAPYLHDGRYLTIPELLASGKHGTTTDLTPQEIEDLAEYVLSL